MFLTPLFAEHMLPWGLKLSYPWPFVALGFLSFTKGGRGGGEVKGEGRGQKGQEGTVAPGQEKERSPWVACCQSMGNPNATAPMCFLPPDFTHTPARPGHQSLTTALARLLSPFEVAHVPER